MSFYNQIARTVHPYVVMLLWAMLMHVPAYAGTTLSTISVTPADSIIGIGQPQTFAATGTFSDGSTQALLGSSVTTVTAGSGHSCVRLASGAVQCWGSNERGQLGNGKFINSSTHVPVSEINNATEVAVAGGSSCAVLASGEVKCWGGNYFGQLGNGTSNQTSPYGSPIPVTVSGISTATAVALGGNYSCALLASGEVQCWGFMIYTTCSPMYGLPCEFRSLVPVTVSGINTATALAVGGDHACVLLASGEVQCWGAGYRTLTPVTVTGISTATVLAAGGNNTCALLASGEVQCWGADFYSYTAPVTVSGISTATALAAGRSHMCALLSSGEVQCWGDNSTGQLGNGTTTSSSLPVSVSGVSTATDLAGTCVLLASGAVQCWGDNTYGQLGNGGTVSSLTPVTVLGTPGIDVAWSSSDPYVASINTAGQVVGLSVGSTLITANSGAASGSASLAVSDTYYSLSVIMQGTGSGTVSGSGIYFGGQTVTVTATVNSGSTFNGWTGANATECATGSVLMDADKNCVATFTLITVDLTPISLTASRSGSKVTVKDTVKNQGNSNIIKAFTVAYYLSTDTVYEPGQEIALASSSNGSGVCTRNVTSLSTGALNSGNKSCYKPAVAQKRTNYYVLVVDDSGNVITESNETNNVRSTTNTVRW